MIVVPVSVAVGANRVHVPLNAHRFPAFRANLFRVVPLIRLLSVHANCVTVVIERRTEAVVERINSPLLQLLIPSRVKEPNERVREEPRPMPEQEQRDAETEEQR